MKLIGFLTAFLLASSVFAESISCKVTEFADSKRNYTNITVQSVDDPHGGIVTIKSILFPDVSGFVSLLQNGDQFFTVLSLYSENMGSNSSGQYQMVVDGQYAQLQLIIPNENLKMSGIEILCQFSKPLPEPRP